MIDHSQCSVEESHQVTVPSQIESPLTLASCILARYRTLRRHLPGGLSTFAHQLLTITLSDSDQELIQTHGGIDCYFPSKEGFDVMFLD